MATQVVTPHPILPGETHIDDNRDSVVGLVRRSLNFNKSLFLRHRHTLFIITVAGVAILINRAMLRRELTHLSFSAEFYPGFDDTYGYGDELISTIDVG